MMEIDTDYKTLSSRHTSVGRILRLFKPWRLRLLLVGLLIAFGAMTGVVSPFLLRDIIDIALPQQDFGLLMWLVLGLLGISVLAACISVLQTILSTVRHADRVFVLKSGKLVEQGSHQELVALDGVYAQLLKSGQST
ncbi:hypothetical protein E5C31_08490 [Providencia rettgeri]|nr:hypothetical protein [Providencia rettgeri]